MNSKLKFALAFGIVGVLTLGNGRAASDAPPTNACSLLTAEQVSSVLGVKVGTGQGLMAKMCKWSEPVPPGAPAKRVMLNLINPQGFAYAKMPGGNGIIKTEVSGIGNDAVYVSASGAPTTLTVKKGDVAFTIIVMGFSDDKTKAKEKVLALDVLAKL
jgi:FlaG/FlaF family flagellin (archaellin)